MFCGKCGTDNPETNKFCRKCGNLLRKNPIADTTLPKTAAPSGAQQAPLFPPDPSVPTPQAAVSAQNYDIPPVGTGHSVPAATRVNPFASDISEQTRLYLSIGSIIAGLISWFRFPYLCGFAAIALGGFVLYTTKDKKSRPALLGIAGIILGLASIVVDLFYLELFRPGK